jgi:excisionase family DNA binding protein
MPDPKSPQRRKLVAAQYPIVIRQTGPALRAINYDFQIEITEHPVSGESEALLQVARLVQMARLRISEHLHSLERAQKNHPLPLSTEALLCPKTKEEISVKQVARLLGEAPHTIRRMADDGELTATRTRKGHRRFLRKDIESILARRSLGG